MDQTEELLDRIELLEAAVRCLAGHEVPELRARRLVITDDGGHDRVVVEAMAGTASVLVRVPGARGATTGIEVFASSASEGDGPRVGICVLRDGDVVGDWSSG